MTYSADDVWRDWNTKGVPASGDRKPVKSEIRGWARAQENRIGVGVARRTAVLLAAVTPAANTYPLGAVTNDPDPANNGFWTWSDSAWQFDRPFPDTISVLSDVGGTANAVTASTKPGVDPAEVIAFILQPTKTNTGSVTLSIDGAAAKTLLDFKGIELAPGAIAADQIVLLVDNGDEYRLLLPALAVATFDHKGTYAGPTTYAEGQVVTGSNGNWYQLKVPTSQGDDPVGSVTGNWLEVLSAVALADGAVTEPKLADGSVIARVITSVASGIAEIAFKLGLQTNGDYTVYAGDWTGMPGGGVGNDTTGDGSLATPYATPQKAWDSLPWLIKDKVVISIADGTYGTSSRSAASMDRPALIYCDGKKIGRRTDGPGGVMTGGVTFMGESKAGMILQPGSVNGYTRAIYVTGHVGSVAFQNIAIDALTGAEAGIVAHRGSYVHLSDIDVDGNGFMTFGLIGEAGGIMEGLVMDVHHCAIGVQSYQGSTVQLSLSSTIYDCSSLGISIPNGGYVGLTTGSSCSSNVLMQAGGRFDCTGTSPSHVTLSGTLNLRGGAWTAAFTDVTGGITTYPGCGVNVGAFGWSAQWTDYGADIYAPGAKSYVSPATQSTVATPLAFIGGVRNLFPESTFQMINNAGVEVSESINGSAVSVPSSGAAITSNLRGLFNVVNLTATANRTGVTLPNTMAGRSPTAPLPAGMVAEFISNSSFTIELVPGSNADFAGLTAITIGASAGAYLGARAVMGTTGLWRVYPLGAVRT